MLMSNKPLFSALVAFVTLSLSASAGIVPVESHILARDPNLVARQAANGKGAPPVHVSSTDKQVVLALTGDDIHSSTVGKIDALEASAIAVPAAEGEKAHCYLGHDTANILSIRYTMRVQLDTDESGTTTVDGHENVQGSVVKTTSGLYQKEDPMKGSCAKTLTRHGEYCADRPYIVPRGVLPAAKDNNGNAEKPVYHPGPYNVKRVAIGPLPGTKVTTDTTIAAHGEAEAPNGATVCIDTVKRDHQVTKVVPTPVENAPAPADEGSGLHFKLMRSDRDSNIWKQVIHDPSGNLIDVTHLEITSKMSFWRAEYFCADCPPGHQKHTVVYEGVEIEIDQKDEQHVKDVPEIKCQGSAAATKVIKQDGNGAQFNGAIFTIDKVTLGAFNINDMGQGKAKYFGAKKSGAAAQDQPQKPAEGEPKKPLKKRQGDIGDIKEPKF